jgi:diguanylate cyclase (GGDEF)-like protein
MQTSSRHAYFRAAVDDTLTSFSRVGFRILRFPADLEARFEADCREERSRRMWFDGLVAICAFNACLFLDYLLVKDGPWMSTVVRTAAVTPVSLAVNEIVRRNPPFLVREGMVAGGMLLISLINLVVEGNTSTASTLFGAICLLITALFVGVVMRLRFSFALPTLAIMLPSGLWSLTHASCLKMSEAVMGSSMLTVGIAIILVTCYSLEAEQRKGYLLGLQHDLQAAELAWANEALKELSNIDNVTRLPNRRALDERVAELWKSCTRTGGALSVVVIDVDHFKTVNDVYGHLFGDEALRHIGSILPQVLRSSDDLACRFGGEEFVLLLPETSSEAALTVAERVRHVIETAPLPVTGTVHSDAHFQMTVSCGVSTYHPGGALRWNDVITTADQALYQAKRNGRNRVEFFPCKEPEPAPQAQRSGENPSSRARRVSQILRARITSAMTGRRATDHPAA